MILQTLIYGEYDLAPLCRKNSLEVSPIRKNGREWTDLDHNEHITTMGWKYEIKVDLNPLTYKQAQEVFDLIKSAPHTLKFQYAGVSQPITQSSVVDNFPLSPTFVKTLCQSSTELIFREAY